MLLAIAAITIASAAYTDKVDRTRRVTLKRGTLLYHGTSAEFDPDDIEAPLWVSESRSVAEWFTSWHEGGDPRVLVFELARDLDDIVLLDSLTFPRWIERCGLDPDGWDVHELAEVTCGRANGWILQENYPDGHDILLCDTSALSFVERYRP